MPILDRKLRLMRMAAFPPWEKEKLDHSDVAADIVDTILKGTGFPMQKIEAVRGAKPRTCKPCSENVPRRRPLRA
jgi:hypothetical protein